jgi:5-methylcytosine-specific restriction endonuclease McrA
MALGDPRPFSKDAALKPGRPRRYRRVVAGPKQWAALRAEKLQGQLCRVCCAPPNIHAGQLHHLISRAQGGDDVADNLVPLCRACHEAVTTRDSGALRRLASSLTDSEYAAIIGKLGEGGMARLFGV